MPTGTSDVNGEIIFSDLVEGEKTITFDAEGVADETIEFVHDGSDQTFTLTTRGDVVLRVLGSSSDDPIEGAEVILTREN